MCFGFTMLIIFVYPCPSIIDSRELGKSSTILMIVFTMAIMTINQFISYSRILISHFGQKIIECEK